MPGVLLEQHDHLAQRVDLEPAIPTLLEMCLDVTTQLLARVPIQIIAELLQNLATIHAPSPP